MTTSTEPTTTTMDIEPTPMDIDHDKPSSTRSPSIESDTSQSSFTDDVETLPASGPASHAHIIDLTEYARQAHPISLQDAVVTTLYNISPATLESFLSPKVHTFKAIFKADKQVVIWRKGLEVFIGTFEHHVSLKVFGFEHIAGLLIGYDGSWHLKTTAGDAYSNPKWQDVWPGKFESYGGIKRMAVEVCEEVMVARARVLARELMVARYWEGRSDVKLT